MKLEEGMYCYDKNNRKLGIGKIINFQSNNNANIRYKNNISLISIGNIISSQNIIDLIEVGDFIDGKQVVNAIHCKDGFNRIELFGGKAIMNKTPIKSIVTKEQFDSMAYKAGE